MQNCCWSSGNASSSPLPWNFLLDETGIGGGKFARSGNAMFGTSGSSLCGSFAPVRPWQDSVQLFSSRERKGNQLQIHHQAILKDLSPSKCFYKNYRGPSSLLIAEFQQDSMRGTVWVWMFTARDHLTIQDQLPCSYFSGERNPNSTAAFER